MAPSATAPPLVGPESTVKVSTQYYFQQEINLKITAVGWDAQREDQCRIQGVQLLHDIRHSLQLPAQTYTCAATYYHRFRLDHKDGGGGIQSYQWQDAAIAALLCACKIEDTLKKSRDILCAVHNFKSTDQLSPDDSRFDAPSNRILGLERMMLESSKFDFRNRSPYKHIVKIAKYAGLDREVAKLAMSILNDSYKTWAPLKQTSSTMVFACLELAAHVLDKDLDKIFGPNAPNYEEFATNRPDIMETLLDIIDLYTHFQKSTTVGPLMDIDYFVQLRILYNKEMSEKGIERFNHCIDPSLAIAKVTPKTPITPASPAETRGNGSSNRTSDMAGPSPRSDPAQKNAGTMRFMLDRNQAREEQAIVDSYHKEEYEEYEIEVDEPIPQKHDRSLGYRGRDNGYHGGGRGRRR
ncbi:cyclin-like protein [Bisporella sp. PMI_857]|nr:cyclin-like protein [Bisporella sp. PMI_857]